MPVIWNNFGLLTTRALLMKYEMFNTTTRLIRLVKERNMILNDRVGFVMNLADSHVASWPVREDVE